jgi:hypothetical protein
MANTSPRPIVSSSTGLVTYVDAGGGTHPALVAKDYGNCVDLVLTDPNVADAYPIYQLDAPDHGVKAVYVTSVPDQGNVVVSPATNVPVVTTSACTLTNSSTSVTVTGGVAGIAPAGSVTGTGVQASTTYTISGTTVTLSQATTGSAAGTGVALTFTPTNPSQLVVTGSTTGIPSSGYVSGAGIPTSTVPNPAAVATPLNPDLPTTLTTGTAYTISGSTVTLAGGVIPTAGATGALLNYSAAPTNFWRYPTSYTI